jgi:CxxC motif-containing protein (DUF1111 family)
MPGPGCGVPAILHFPYLHACLCRGASRPASLTMRSSNLLFVLSCATSLAVAQSPQPKMGAPLHGLTAAQLQRFTTGRADFSRVIQIGEGLGPIFNQTSCASCHNNPIGGPGSIKVFRFGYDDGKGNFDPLTALGGTLLQAQTINVACAETIPAAANVTAQRVTPSALGTGLVEAIADADIAVRETSPPSPTVSGRVHWVRELENPTGPLRAGRMGWKAQLATSLSFSADATQNELGMTNRLLPTENPPNGNVALVNQFDTVADPEDGPDAQGQHFIDRINDFQRYLAAPPQTPRSGMTGEALFQQVGCANCHVATFTTRNDPALEPSLRNQVIKPYSDFLLHDMGGAADFIADGSASGQEMRTPSLWGVRNRVPLWHDGRVAGGTLSSRMLGAGGVIELHNAIGSEAQPSAQAFNALSTADKDRVVAFLDSLGRAEFDGNGDNVRDRHDLPGFLAARAGGPWTPNSPEAVYDFDQNGVVNQADLAVFAQVYEEDCNGNGTSDLLDILSGYSGDANGNLLADDCETCQTSLGFAGAGTLALSICGDGLTGVNGRASFLLRNGPSNGLVLIAIGVAANPTPVTPTEILVPLMPLAALVQGLVTDANGRVLLPMIGGSNLPIMTWVFQAATFDGTAFDLSNALSVNVGGF